MPRPRPPYLHREQTRHGAVAWYVRIGADPRIRIRGEYGSPEFTASYHAAIAGVLPQRARAASGTLAWIIDRYRDSGTWARLARNTQQNREGIFKHVCQTAGGMPFAKITKNAILEGRDRRKATPFAADEFVQTMRALFKWAKSADFVPDNPADGVAAIGKKGDGHHVWTDEEIAKFEAYWPVGSRERLALAILLYTGLRRGDSLRFGRQHIRDGVIALRTGKTGVQIIIPVLPELALHLSDPARHTGGLAFLTKAHGAPMTSSGFGNWFRRACQAAGVPGSAHGLRKAGATRAANNGATVAQLNAIFGWKGERMASHYTQTADRMKLARDGMEKLRTK